MELKQGRVEELQVPRWIDNRTAEQSAWIYQKFDNVRGSDYARARSVELDVSETTNEELGDIAGGCQVRAMIMEISHDIIRHICSVDDVMKGQAK